MIIILEGENKTGKSTLAKKIVDEYGFDYVKCSQPKGDPYIEYMNILRKIEKSGKNTVIDRFLYGEFVYGPLYRGKSNLTMTQKRNIELKALSLNAFMIYCMDDPKKIAKRFKEENEEFADDKKIVKTLDLFTDILEESHIPFFTHKMKSKLDLTKGQKLATIIEIVNEYDQIPRLKTAVGSTEQKIVLVGEKRNERLMPEYKKFDQPFDFGVSSEYLFNELAIVDVPLSQYTILNADSSELKKLNGINSIIFSMGRVAHQKLEALDIPHTKLNHPSYERRFHGKKHRMAKQIKKVLKIYNYPTV